MSRRWDIGGGCPAVDGGAMSAVRVANRPANDRPAPIASADLRATVHVAERTVRLRRHLPSGLEVGVSVALDTYQGVSVDVLMDAAAGLEGYRLILAHADSALDIVLIVARDDTDLVANWRGLSRDLGLPMLMRTETGDEAVEARLGRIAVRPHAPRRAPRAFLKRRPNVLRRRQIPLQPLRTA